MKGGCYVNRATVVSPSQTFYAGTTVEAIQKTDFVTELVKQGLYLLLQATEYCKQWDNDTSMSCRKGVMMTKIPLEHYPRYPEV